MGSLEGSGDLEAVAKVQTLSLYPWRLLYPWRQLSALCGVGLLSRLDSRPEIVACDARLLSPPFCFSVSPRLLLRPPLCSQAPRLLELSSDLILSFLMVQSGKPSVVSFSLSTRGKTGQFPKGGHAFSDRVERKLSQGLQWGALWRPWAQSSATRAEEPQPVSQGSVLRGGVMPTCLAVHFCRGSPALTTGLEKAALLIAQVKPRKIADGLGQHS